MTYGIEEATVRTMTYTESRARYAETLDAVVDDREEVIVTRPWKPCFRGSGLPMPSLP